MPEVAFVMSAGQRPSLRELAATLQYELGLQGVPASLHDDGFPAGPSERVYVLLDPLGYVATEGEQALPDDSVLKRTIFLCAEPPASAAIEQHRDLLERAGAVFVGDQRGVVAMHRLRIPARLLRLGYSRSLDRFDPAASRPIDVMFLGTHSLRRTRYLNHAARVLARRNCLLQVSEPNPCPGSPPAESGRPQLARSKILINLHRGEESHFEWHRGLDAIHAGAVVVTEHSSGLSPLVAGEHLLVAAPESLPYVVDALLGDEERLARLRAQAYERVSTWIPSALWVSVLRAAVVELVGEPVATNAALGVLAKPAPAPAPPAEPPALEEVPGPATDGAGGFEVTHESPTWSAQAAPRVTVVTTLSSDGQTAGDTLDSLARSRLRDLELGVVDAGTGDAARKVVTDWMTDHPSWAARMIVPGVARGTGAARNIALEVARGEYSLILDPGQELYPRCLEVLVEALETMPAVAFAYPIQQVTGDADEFVDAGGDYLMSFLAWDPSRLRLGNHIHAPALIRTERLRELGGFVTDARLDGLEDYDLWCRFAERGWRGQLVCQELARRAESGSSAALSSIRPAPGAATSALMERAPRLLAGAF
jgi:hypothetical protein